MIYTQRHIYFFKKLHVAIDEAMLSLLNHFTRFGPPIYQNVEFENYD